MSKQDQNKEGKTFEENILHILSEKFNWTPIYNSNKKDYSVSELVFIEIPIEGNFTKNINI